MKPTILLLALAATTFSINAQKTQPLKQVIELKMPKTAEDDMPGKRGASVAWHPVQKKIFCSFRGQC